MTPAPPEVKWIYILLNIYLNISNWARRMGSGSGCSSSISSSQARTMSFNPPDLEADVYPISSNIKLRRSVAPFVKFLQGLRYNNNLYLKDECPVDA